MAPLSLDTWERDLLMQVLGLVATHVNGRKIGVTGVFALGMMYVDTSEPDAMIIRHR